MGNEPLRGISCIRTENQKRTHIKNAKNYPKNCMQSQEKIRTHTCINMKPRHRPRSLVTAHLIKVQILVHSKEQFSQSSQLSYRQQSQLRWAQSMKITSANQQKDNRNIKSAVIGVIRENLTRGSKASRFADVTGADHKTLVTVCGAIV